jgi:ribosome-binding factor A
MTRRSERVSNIIRQEISEMLQERINDPRLKSFISITRVVTSSDLTSAKVYVSVMGDDVDKNEVLEGFKSASGFFRRELAHQLTLRHVPELSFQFDDSIEVGTRILRLIEQTTAENSEELT